MAASLKPSNLFASIDMGTNSFKLLIVHFEPTTAKFTTLHHISDPVVLGRDSSSSSSSSPPLISADSQIRAIEALRKFQTVLRANDVPRTRIVATSAIREAGNGSDFVDEVREKLGVDFEVNILSGVEEARLIYLGVVQFCPVYDKRVLTVDIGGGSTEFVIGDHGEVVYAESLRLGHVTLTQKFGEGDLVGLRDYVRGEIEASGLVDKVKGLGFDVAIGSSGTIRAIEKAIWSGYGCEERERLRFVGEGLEGRRRSWWWFSREELRGLVERLCEESQRMRDRRDGFFGRRSEFIVAGAVLLEEILEVLRIGEMRVSGYALGEGVVAEMISNAYVGLDMNTNVRWKSVVRLAMRFNGKDRMRNGAQCAAIAKESNQLDGYTLEEIELIALLARHHRKKFPSFDHTSLQGFSGEKFGILCFLLRLSFIFLKHKSLELRGIKFYHSHEGFVLALEEDKPLLPGSEQSIAKDIETKIRKEVAHFEVVLHQKLLVVTRTHCLESSTRQ